MPKRILQGTVISNKADKTISVLVERKIMHPVYKKYIKRTKKYAVHDEKNESKIGEIVKIQDEATMKMSKLCPKYAPEPSYLTSLQFSMQRRVEPS